VKWDVTLRNLKQEEKGPREIEPTKAEEESGDEASRRNCR
jgi:hypothetical protein